MGRQKPVGMVSRAGSTPSGNRHGRSWDTPLFILAGTLSLFPFILVLSLVFQSTSTDWDQVLYRPTLLALRNSFSVFIVQGLIVLPIALLLGVVSALFEFPFRRISLILSFFPVILPGFVAAIGIQSLNSLLPFDQIGWVDGLQGSIWTGVVMSLPIATMGTFLAVRSIAVSELESVFQVGGKTFLAGLVLKRVFHATLACVCLSGLIGFSDFGVSNIMGFHGIASEIQTIFATEYDSVLATCKAILLLGLIFPLFFLIYSYLPRPIESVRQLGAGFRPMELPFFAGIGIGFLQLICCSIGSVALMTGLMRPLLRPNSLVYVELVWSRYWDSIGLTLFYGLGSGLFATALGFLLSAYFFSKHSPKFLKSVAIFLGLSFILPSCISALGIAWLGTQLPHWMDFIMRSEWVVILTMGIRFAPLTAMLYFLGFASMPRARIDVHRMIDPPWVFSKVQLQFLTLWKWGGLGFVVSSILTLADVGTTTLVQPPGGNSFGAYFFGSMDNSPEVLVSSMCFAYMSTPVVIAGVSFLVYCSSKMLAKHFSNIPQK